MTNNYRKIYEKHHKCTILKGNHIHHIDGNHSNNDIDNLLLCTPEEHFNIHLSQGDIVALRGKFIQGAYEASKKAAANRIWVKTGPNPKKACPGEKNGMFGKKHKEESIKLMKERTPDKNGDKNPFYGKKHSTNTKQIQSDLKRGDKNPFYGKKHSQEYLDRVNGRLRYTDGKTSICVYPGDIIPEGFYPGGGRSWYNNGTESKMLLNSDLNDGWVKGRLCKIK